MSDYKLLGVSDSATIDEIHTAYKRLAMKYHPDRNADPTAPDKFKEISAAYRRIKNPSKQILVNKSHKYTQQPSIDEMIKTENSRIFLLVEALILHFKYADKLEISKIYISRHLSRSRLFNNTQLWYIISEAYDRYATRKTLRKTISSVRRLI